jgi:hypothetical protein
MRSHVQPGSFPLLLVTSVLLYVLNGLAADSMGGAALVQVARVGVVCAGFYVLSARRGTMWIGIVVAGLVGTLEARLWGIDPRLNRVLQDTTVAAFSSGSSQWCCGESFVDRRRSGTRSSAHWAGS